VLKLRMRTLIALGALAVQTTFAGRAFGLRSPLFIGSELLLLLCILIISRVVLPLVERHDRGAKGEEHVGGLLDGLTREGWHVIHDASLGRGDVDHVAIGPAGIFTVETKSRPSPVYVSRVHGATLRQAKAQRKLLERAIRMHVQPLIVYSRAWVDRPLTRRKGVRVLPARMLVRFLTEQERSLSDQQIDEARSRVLQALATAEAAAEIFAHDCDGRHRMIHDAPTHHAPTYGAPTHRAPTHHAPTGARGSVLRRARNRSHHT
jgi:hypothetical protein